MQPPHKAFSSYDLAASAYSSIPNGGHQHPGSPISAAVQRTALKSPFGSGFGSAVPQRLAAALSAQSALQRSASAGQPSALQGALGAAAGQLTLHGKAAGEYSGLQGDAGGVLAGHKGNAAGALAGMQELQGDMDMDMDMASCPTNNHRHSVTQCGDKVQAIGAGGGLAGTVKVTR